MVDRSSSPHVRNPLLGLQAFIDLGNLPAEDRAILRRLLRQIRSDAAQRAQQAWRSNKGPMAAYWKAVSVYAYHTSRGLR